MVGGELDGPLVQRSQEALRERDLRHDGGGEGVVERRVWGCCWRRQNESGVFSDDILRRVDMLAVCESPSSL